MVSRGRVGGGMHIPNHNWIHFGRAELLFGGQGFLQWNARCHQPLNFATRQQEPCEPYRHVQGHQRWVVNGPGHKLVRRPTLSQHPIVASSENVQPSKLL